MEGNKPLKGRGAQYSYNNRFHRWRYEEEADYREHLHRNGEKETSDRATLYQTVHPKSILNPVISPDISAKWSLNPYQGCEHGCAYCYARNSHEYWDLDAGLDFEQVILIKKAAPQLLQKALTRPNWKGEPIMFSGNTDCYQPAERKFALTRACLQILHDLDHPVGIITKNSLILRDLDLLKPMAAKGLVKVSISITTLDDALRRKLEPRTATVQKKLKTVELLSQIGVPVNIMFAPVIPGLNSHEAMKIAKVTAERGARTINYTAVRLNGILGSLFADWLECHYPERKQKVLNGVAAMHEGQVNDHQYGRRMKGSGKEIGSVKQSIALARKKYFAEKVWPDYERGLFKPIPKGQHRLFH